MIILLSIFLLKAPRLPELALKEIFKHLNLPWRYEDQINPDNFDINEYKYVPFQNSTQCTIS